MPPKDCIVWELMDRLKRSIYELKLKIQSVKQIIFKIIQ